MSIVEKSGQQYFGFDPRTLPGCQLWLDAADSSTITFASGTNISQWADKSGNGRNFSNVNAATQPTLETTGLSGTSNNVLFSPTTNSYLTNASFNGFSATTFDMYSVIRLGSSGGQAAIFWGQPSSLQMIIGTASGINGANTTFHTNGIWRLAPTEGYNSSAFPHIFNVYSTGTQIGRRYQGWDFNGLSNQVATYSFPGFSASEVTFFRSVSGAWSSTPMRVGEVILFNRVLTAYERRQIEGYLGWKWGIQTQYTRTTTFSPTSISGCQLWLDAADSASFTPSNPSNGSLISQWNDKSGNARHMSNGLTASQPRYRTGRVEINGYPTVHFDSTSATGTNRGLLSNSTFTGLNTSTWDVFAVMSVQSSGSTALIWDDPSSLQHIIACYTTSSTGANNILHTTGTWRLTPTTGYIEPNTPRIIQTYSTGSQVGRRVNGYFYGNATDQVTNFNFPPRTGNRPFFIANPTGGWSTGNLYLSELIIYNSVLSDSNRSSVENYLRAKWGVTDGIIPISHPLYYNPAAMRIFQPNDISGCALWLDAADSNTITGTTNVTQWNDKSGNGRNATSPSGPSVSTYNGRQVLAFNGSSQYFNNSTTVPLNAHTLIAVHVPTTITGSGQGNGDGNTSLFRFQNVNYIVFPYMNTTTPRGYITNQGGSGAGSIDFQNSTLVENSVTTNLNIIIAAIASGSQLIFRNGTQQSSNTRTLSSSAESDALHIGRYAPNNNEYYQGSLGEMIIFNRQLTSNERQQVEGYLAAKWGLSGSLPTTQPYYLQRALPSTPLFTPTMLSNLGLWLDGADPSSITVSSGTSNVTQWRDKSGNNRHATGLTSKWTTYTAGTNYIQFTAANNSVLSCTGMNVVVNTQYTFFTVYRRNNPPTNPVHPNIQFFCGGSDGSTNARLHIGYESSTSMKYAQWANQYSVTVPALTSPEPINVWGFMQTSNQRIMYLNGTIPSGGTNSNSSLVSAQNGGVIGAYQSDPFYSLDGRLYEFIIFTRALSATERQQMEGYLAWKYGAQTNLPTTHPYYRFRP